MRVQPEIKMANVKPETLKPDIADGIYVKFQRNPHIFCIEQHSGTNLSTERRQGGWEIKNGGLEQEVDIKYCISQLVYMIPIFRCQATRLDGSKQCRLSR